MNGTDEFFPKGDGLSVGIVHAEDLHTLIHPEDHNIDQLTPEIFPVGAVEVDGVDVLIFFGRIFCVADAAIWTLVEPIRMIFDIRMVWLAVDGEVESDL